MAIKDWHIGKLIIVWIWCFLIGFLCIKALSIEAFALSNGSYFALFGLLAGAAMVGTYMTWKWIGGKEKKKEK